MLSWGIGDADTAEQQQPVVGPFRNGVQLASMLVTENMLRRLIEEPSSETGDNVDRAVATWQALLDR